MPAERVPVQPGCRRVLALQPLITLLLIALLLGGFTSPALASGPRYIQGPPFFTGSQGAAIGWKQSTLLYSTDPADLSVSVNHAQADALVASAAGVWNVPVASISVAQGGQLAEHADSTNVYLDANGMQYPADVQSSNAAAIPIAVLYDSDGSVTDMLLGPGASDPSNCRQSSVSESVDKFDPAGFILHAVIVINGRCTGPASEQQMELRYKLERVFGRVLGLGWSQANDNVFTGTPVPSYAQEQHWPILHPIDIFCGPYDYQCLPQPFQLRDDDIASLVDVYPIARGTTPPPGKQPSLSNANQVTGHILFPNGQGMAGVNILVHRQIPNSQTRDAWVEGSNVSGMAFRRADVSPFVTAATDALSSMGTTNPRDQASYFVSYLPILIDTLTGDDLVVSTEPVNPLYVGSYSLGPYNAGIVSPAGANIVLPPSTIQYPYGYFNSPITLSDAPQACGSGSDGTLSTPMQEPTSGWWTGQICGYGHASYIAADVKPARSFTLEVTALDAQGFATTAKLMPVLAFFDTTDTSSFPSLGLSSSAFQSSDLGTTNLNGVTGQMTRIRLGIADQRGEGRPDFPYQARLFYADNVVPAQLGPDGGNVTITGTGFRRGNSVQINGVTAAVASWSATSIVAIVPTMSQTGAAPSAPLDITVSDLGTGASSTMSGAFQYGSSTSLPNVMKLLSAQAGTGFVSQSTPVPFSVQVLQADGVTSVAGETVTFSSAAANVIFDACGATVCTLITDANGVVRSVSTPTAVGSITLRASDGALQQSANFSALAQSGSIVVTSTIKSLPVGSTATFSVTVLAPNGSGMSGRTVQFGTPSGNLTFSGCFTSVCSVVTNSAGSASLPVTPTAAGTVTLTASDGDVSAQSTLQATDNSDVILITRAPPANLLQDQSAGMDIQLLKHDGVTPDGYQTIIFTGTTGANLVTCGTTQVCSLVTDYQGMAEILARPAALGTYSLTATYGSVGQTATFNVVALPPVQIHILSMPSDGLVVGTVAPQPFTVQLLKGDGVTPLTGVQLTLAGPSNGVRLGYCNSGSCQVYVDSRGIATTSVTPLLTGAITLDAVYLGIEQSSTFTTLGPAATLQFTAQPGASGVVVGESNPLTVQAVAIGGSGPGTGYVSMIVDQGSAIVSPCVFPCGPKLDINGTVNFYVRAIAPGPIAITATWGALHQTANFYAYATGDVMELLSGPSGIVSTQIPTTPVFAVKVFGTDGVTPAPGKSVTFATSIGSVRFAACGATTCTVTTDANGYASSAVMPLVEGVTTVTAYDGAVNQAATFVAQDRPDVLSLVSVPSSGSFVSASAPMPFSVRVLLADGVTPATGRNVTLVVTNGLAGFMACAGAAFCSLPADANGMVTTSVVPGAAGIISLLATDRTVQLSAGFNAVLKSNQMLLLSAPAVNVTLGQALAPAFSVRLLDGFGNPLGGHAIVFSTSSGSVLWGACALPVCTLVTGADGIATITAIPTSAGSVALLASADGVSQTASIVSVMPADTLALVSSPATGSQVGSVAAVPFAVQVLAGYPAHPTGGKSVTMQVTQASAVLTACGQAICTVLSNAAGVASSGVISLVAGPVTVIAQEGGASLSATFNADPVHDLLANVSSVPLQIHVGDPVALEVQALAPVSLVADVGHTLQFTLVSGTASLGGCAGAVCSAVTDARGIASLTVVPGVLGTVSLLVTDSGVANAQQLPVLLRIVPFGYTIAALQPHVYVVEDVSLDFIAAVQVAQGELPAVALPVTWSGGIGFSVGNSSVLSDAAGIASVAATAGPLNAGASASVTACAVKTICASYSATGVAVAALRLGVLTGAGQSVSAGAAYANVVAAVNDDSAHPVAGAAVTVYQTVTAAAQACPVRGRCPAAPVLASRVTVLRSGLDGRLVLQPLTVTGVATQTQIAFSAGTQGFVTTVLSSNP
jgi:hypothetical protein